MYKNSQRIGISINVFLFVLLISTCDREFLLVFVPERDLRNIFSNPRSFLIRYDIFEIVLFWVHGQYVIALHAFLLAQSWILYIDI